MRARQIWLVLRRPPWRTVVVLLVLGACASLGYACWSPGDDFGDGRHDLGRNAMWLGHAWIGDDEWFIANDKHDEMAAARSGERLAGLALELRDNRIRDVFPHLGPAQLDGRIPAVDDAQLERVLDALAGARVMPWIGGVRDVHAFPDSETWRASFAASAAELVRAHPRLAGVHLNIEPCPSGDPGFLATLDELRAALPDGKTLSVAAYPPPTWLHPFADVHWDEPYYREVARRSDQLAVMMYDTALWLPKPYQWLVARWTREVLTWAEGSDVLLGVPTYADEGVGYHHPEVENLDNALRGVHGGLASFATLPRGYQGLAIYSHWETDQREWAIWRERFAR